ncbi:hypothetical protein K501DRAFT_272696 [Backusella circina FSU 941]|nr:hypothetical protein K501DRAFT_272696 [Backusella circina FSU 941]
MIGFTFCNNQKIVINMLLSYLSYLYSIFLFKCHPSYISVGLINPPPSTTIDSYTTSTTASTSAISTPSIQLFTLQQESTSLATTLPYHWISKETTSSPTKTNLERGLIPWTSSKATTSTTMTPPNYDLRRQFFQVEVIDGSKNKTYQTMVLNYFAQDETAINEVLSRTIMMVIKYPEGGFPRTPQPKGPAGNMGAILWHCFLYLFKVIYWVTFVYHYYTFWNTYIFSL